MELIKAKAEDFEVIYSEMEKSFVREEIRDRARAREVMDEENYVIYHVTDDDTRVGFITIWELSGFAFAEHFVTYEEFRNKGYGKEALKMIEEKYKKVVLEVEPPEDGIKKRRIAFYKRQGFFENAQPYIQPPYRDEDEGVPLIIMSYPAKLSDFEAHVTEIYGRVYNKTYRSTK